MSAVAHAVRVAPLSTEACELVVMLLTSMTSPGVLADVGGGRRSGRRLRRGDGRLVAHAQPGVGRLWRDAVGQVLVAVGRLGLLGRGHVALRQGGRRVVTALRLERRPDGAEVDRLRERLGLLVLVVGDGRGQRDGVAQATSGRRQLNRLCLGLRVPGHEGRVGARGGPQLDQAHGREQRATQGDPQRRRRGAAPADVCPHRPHALHVVNPPLEHREQNERSSTSLRLPRRTPRRGGSPQGATSAEEMACAGPRACPPAPTPSTGPWPAGRNDPPFLPPMTSTTAGVCPRLLHPE